MCQALKVAQISSIATHSSWLARACIGYAGLVKWQVNGPSIGSGRGHKIFGGTSRSISWNYPFVIQILKRDCSNGYKLRTKLLACIEVNTLFGPPDHSFLIVGQTFHLIRLAIHLVCRTFCVWYSGQSNWVWPTGPFL